jgi:mannose/fructose/N-acetylgalactosamine-specific phosphotransferase system component IIC
MAVWAGLALAVGFTLSLRHMLARLWAWSLTMCLVFVLYRVVPIRFWDYRVNLSALLVGVSVLAVVVLFAVVFDVGQRPEERRDERP